MSPYLSVPIHNSHKATPCGEILEIYIVPQCSYRNPFFKKISLACSTAYDLTCFFKRMTLVVERLGKGGALGVRGREEAPVRI